MGCSEGVEFVSGRQSIASKTRAAIGSNLDEEHEVRTNEDYASSAPSMGDIILDVVRALESNATVFLAMLDHRLVS
jgi:hypothetical protein